MHQTLEPIPIYQVLASDNDPEFDHIIGRFDFILSRLMMYRKQAKEGTLSDANRQTLKHHAEDAIAAGQAILQTLGSNQEGLPQPNANASIPCSGEKSTRSHDDSQQVQGPSTAHVLGSGDTDGSPLGSSGAPPEWFVRIMSEFYKNQADGTGKLRPRKSKSLHSGNNRSRSSRAVDKAPKTVKSSISRKPYGFSTKRKLQSPDPGSRRSSKRN